MITKAEEIGQSDSLFSHDLKTLATATPPCLSISVPFQQKSRTHRRLQKAVNEIETRLHQDRMDPAAIRNLLDPLSQLAATVENEQVDSRGEGLVVLRSPELMLRLWVREQLSEWTIVAERFFIRPLLPMIAADRPFYILALSQKRIRLLRCNGQGSTEVSLPTSVPTNLAEALQTAKPDHVLDNRSTSGPSTGSMKGVVFGTGTDREHKDEYLLQFYSEVDRGLGATLRNRHAPVVLAGVDYEIALYHRLSTYPNLVEGAVQGAPDSLTDGDLHKRALKVLEQQPSPALERALAQFRKQGGPPGQYQSPRAIIKAAGEGRVSFLFLVEGAQYPGLPEEEDPLNATILETLRHGGEVFLIPSGQLDEISTMAAVLRY